MTPSELRELMLYAPRTDETFRRLPTEAGGVWCSHPGEGDFAMGRLFMQVRVVLLVSAAIYLLFFHKSIGEAQVLPFVIAAYEFAYYNARRERETLTLYLARERYASRVNDLLAKLYPGYRQPAEP